MKFLLILKLFSIVTDGSQLVENDQSTKNPPTFNPGRGLAGQQERGRSSGENQTIP
jgi:hypothetical protein